MVEKEALKNMTNSYLFGKAGLFFLLFRISFQAFRRCRLSAAAFLFTETDVIVRLTVPNVPVHCIFLDCVPTLKFYSVLIVIFIFFFLFVNIQRFLSPESLLVLVSVVRCLSSSFLASLCLYIYIHIYFIYRYLIII